MCFYCGGSLNTRLNTLYLIVIKNTIFGKKNVFYRNIFWKFIIDQYLIVPMYLV